MNTKGSTLQIFLPSGSPQGVKEAVITHNTIKVIQIPRSEFNEEKKRLSFNGIYILVDSLRSEKPKIYIGKGKVDSRISQHNSNKDLGKGWWNLLFAIKLDRFEGFNDAHCGYLEHFFIKKAKALKLSDACENKQMPTEPEISESLISECLHYIECIEILLSTLGLKCFQIISTNADNNSHNATSKKNVESNEIYECKDTYGSYAKGIYTEDGILVLRGAICKKELHRGTDKLTKRDNLIKEGTLVLKSDSCYILKENTLFSSLSTASSVVLGRQSNGWLDWKRGDKTIDELKRSIDKSSDELQS